MQIPRLWVAETRAQLTHPHRNEPKEAAWGIAREQGLLHSRKRHRNSSLTNCAQPWASSFPLSSRYIWAHRALLGPWWVRGQNYCLQQEKGHRSISIKQHPFMCCWWAKQSVSLLLSYFFLNPFPPSHQQNWIWGDVFHLEDNSWSTPFLNLCFKVSKGCREMSSSIGTFKSNQ